MTSNNKRFICHARYDQSVRQLADNIKQVYNEMLADPTHKYYRPNYKASRVYNLRVRSFYLRHGDILSDILNDYDEVECDVEEHPDKHTKIKQESNTPSANKG